MSVAPFPKPNPSDMPLAQIELEQLRETAEVQSRTIRFLLSNWDALVAQSSLKFGLPIVLLQNATIPAGTWLCTNPASGPIATVTVQTTTPPSPLTFNAPGPFVSDGTAVVTAAGGVTLVPVTGA